MRRDKNTHGYLTILALFTFTGIAIITTAGLTRSMTEQLAAKTEVANYQAFHLAEAGIDEELVLRQGAFTQQGIATLVAAPERRVDLPNGSHYLVDYVEDGDPNDDIVWLIATGIVPPGDGDTRQTLRLLIQLPTSGSTPVFEYTVAAQAINMNGGAELGTSLSPIKLYVSGSTADSGGAPLILSASNRIYASVVDFVNPRNELLSDLCPRCPPPPTDNFNFPGPPTFNYAPPRPPLDPTTLTIDFNPYYSKAIEQCVQEGHTQADCESGAASSDHHITSDKTLGARGETTVLNGVIYVEKGANLTLRGDVTLYGTIVHEGFDDGPNTGIITKPDDGTLAIQPASDGFANGLAIVGAAVVDLTNSRSTMDIHGFIMGRGSPSGGEKSTTISCSGLIEGGIIGATPGYPWLETGVPGPGMGSVKYGITPIYIGGSARLAFKPPVQTPGFPSSGSGGKVVVHLWTTD